jgi:chromate transporter
MKAPPSIGEALPVWMKIGCLGFGGPSGQIALLHTEIVEKREWVGEAEFIRALQFCMLLPGPEAQQLATYLGWRMHGIKGGIAAGLLFFIPAALLLWCLSLLYVLGEHWPLLMAFFAGLKPAVVAIVFSACWRIGKRTIMTIRLALLALLALAIFSFTSLPYPLVVLIFGFFGIFFLKEEVKQVSEQSFSSAPEASWNASFHAASLIVICWLLPMVGLFIWLGPEAMPVKVALFFSKVAVVSFGGAYAALSYVSLHAAGDWGWLTSGQMMDGLGLAETTPGPLLIALQFVAFLAAYKAPGLLTPLLAATLASAAACWALFIPSFLWIFSLAPHLDRLAGNHRISAALSAIGAVVTAVIAHLALWFAGSLFLPHGTLAGVAVTPVLLSLIAFLVLQTKRIGIVPVILLSGVTSLLLKGMGWMG